MKINEVLTESQLDELKCWNGYKRVPGVPAGAPGSCRKATSEDQQLDELSPQTLARYKKAAGASAREADKAGDFERGNKRFSGIVRATKKEFDQATKKKPEQGVAEGRGDMVALQRIVDFAVKHGYKIKRSLDGREMEFVNDDLYHEVNTELWRDEESGEIWVNFYDSATGMSGNDPAVDFYETFKDAYETALADNRDDMYEQGVAEGLGDTQTQVLGKYRGWRFEVETQTEDDRYVKFYGAVSPDGKWHMLPKRATAEQFKQFVDGQGVAESEVPSRYLSGTEKVDNISPVLTKPYGSARQTKLMKNSFGSS